MNVLHCKLIGTPSFARSRSSQQLSLCKEKSGGMIRRPRCQTVVSTLRSILFLRQTLLSAVQSIPVPYLANTGPLHDRALSFHSFQSWIPLSGCPTLHASDKEDDDRSSIPEQNPGPGFSRLATNCFSHSNEPRGLVSATPADPPSARFG